MTAAEFLKTHHPLPSWTDRDWNEWAHENALRADEIAIEAERMRRARIAAEQARKAASAAVRSAT